MALYVAQELDGATGRLTVARVLVRPEQLEATARQILRRWIEERAMVGERDVIQIEPVVVGVERAPPAVEALHAEHPAEPALFHRA